VVGYPEIDFVKDAVTMNDMYLAGYLGKEAVEHPSLFSDPYSMVGTLGGAALGAGAADLFGKDTSALALLAGAVLGGAGGYYAGDQYGKHRRRLAEPPPKTFWQRLGGGAKGAGRLAYGGLSETARGARYIGREGRDWIRGYSDEHLDQLRNTKKQSDALLTKAEERARTGGEADKERLERLQARPGVVHDFNRTVRETPGLSYGENLHDLYIRPPQESARDFRKWIWPLAEDIN